jgi:hypothetical protein
LLGLFFHHGHRFVIGLGRINYFLRIKQDEIRSCTLKLFWITADTSVTSDLLEEIVRNNETSRNQSELLLSSYQEGLEQFAVQQKIGIF